jgi:hypothetical protein
MKKLVIVLLLLGCAVFLGAAIYQTLQARELRAQAFRADSLAAEADTARALALAALDSAENAWQRRIVQTELQRDSLDRELRERPVIRIAAGVRVDTLRFTDTVYVTPSVGADSVKSYEFDGVDPPFGFRGSAEIYPNNQGIFHVNVFQTDPIPIHARVTCGEGGGVNTASILFTASDPFEIVPGRVEQDRSVCNPREPVEFSLLPELSIRGVGWELVKGIGWILAANWVDDRFHKAKY